MVKVAFEIKSNILFEGKKLLVTWVTFFCDAGDRKQTIF